jgi:hypothetical protein
MRPVCDSGPDNCIAISPRGHSIPPIPMIVRSRPQPWPDYWRNDDGGYGESPLSGTLRVFPFFAYAAVTGTYPLSRVDLRPIVRKLKGPLIKILVDPPEAAKMYQAEWNASPEIQSPTRGPLPPQNKTINPSMSRRAPVLRMAAWPSAVRMTASPGPSQSHSELASANVENWGLPEVISSYR